jgi:hypothetical protein
MTQQPSACPSWGKFWLEHCYRAFTIVLAWYRPLTVGIAEFDQSYPKGQFLIAERGSIPRRRSHLAWEERG